MRWTTCLAAGLVALVTPRAARADGAPEPAAPPGATEKRPILDYDGRDEPTTGGDVLLWVPRVVFYPLYVVSEYALRRPLGYAIRAAEKAGIKQFLASSSDYLVFPTVVADFGFRTSIGIYGGINDLFVPGHQVRLRVAFGGVDFWKVKAKDRYIFDGGRQRIGVFASYRQRADDTFGGIGPDIRYDNDAVGRFTTRVTEGGMRYDYGLDSPTSFELDATLRDVRFDGKSCCGPALVEQIERGEVAAPPGFAEGYMGFHGQVIAALDSRRELASRGPWARAEVRLGADMSFERPESLRWASYGGEIGGGIELPSPHRRIQLSLATLFADPLAEEPIPLTGLVHLGGDRYLRGFGGDAFSGRSAVVATLKYSWPIWMLLDGNVHVAAGNTYGPHLGGFAPEKLRLSFGPGISTNFIDEDRIIDLMVAFGTDTFEQGSGIASVRVAFGMSEGF